jgi:hypothetical protein
MFRRTIVRYLNLTFVMAMSKVSPRVKRRFPTVEHMIEAGTLTLSSFLFLLFLFFSSCFYEIQVQV